MDKEKDNVIKAYKGFNQDFKCRDMQYEVGKEYEHDGSIKCCDSGFHACENPLDVLDYYDIVDSRFAEVELSGDIDKERERDSNDTKLCASKIAVKAELKLADFIKLSVEYLKELVKPNPKDIDSGDYSQLASSGYGSQLASSGDRSVVMNAGVGGIAKAKKGSWITLAEWDYGKGNCYLVPVCVKTVQVDGEIIKEDTWYRLTDGEFEEVAE